MKTIFLKIFIGFVLLIISNWTLEAQNVFTFAGTGATGYSGDNGFATLAKLNGPIGVFADASGNVFVADESNHCIRKINSSGIIMTIAGTGTAGYSGDGGLATLAQLNHPLDVKTDASGNVYIADALNNVIRKINTSGIITTIAGTGAQSFSGDGGQATSATFYDPIGIALDVSGNLYIADRGNKRIRKINTSGIITTIAGNGGSTYSGDGGLATSAGFFETWGVAVDNSGNVFISTPAENRIRKVNTSGIINTIAGTGVSGYSGDNGPAASSLINYPTYLSLDASGNIYIADTYNNCIRQVNSSGTITTLASFIQPRGISVDLMNNFFVTQTGGVGNRVYEICSGSCLAGINSIPENKNTILIYPNPNNGSFKIKIDNEIENGIMFLFNPLGQKVHEQKIIKGENTITTNNLSKGLYHYTISENKQVILIGRMVVD